MMERGNSLLRYKSIDLLIWVVMMGVFETLIVKAGSVWFTSQPYILSLVPALTTIVYMRWSLWGVLYASLGGFFLVSASSAAAGQWLVYIIGNLLSVLVYPVMVKVGKERITSSAFLSALCAVLTAVLMQAGRGLVSLCEGNGISDMLAFFTTDALSGVFAVIIILVVRKRDGVFEDQISYLRRLRKEEEEKKNEGNGF